VHRRVSLKGFRLGAGGEAATGNQDNVEDQNFDKL
jgi:hypothetical protein